MTVADYWASKIRELIAEAHASGVEITGHSTCCGCSRGITLDIDAGLIDAEVKITDD